MNKIFLISGKARSGKDTVFNLFEDILGRDRVKRWAFADYLKEICSDYFYWNGVKDDKGRNLLIKVGQFLRGEFEVDTKNSQFIFDTNKFDFDNLLYCNEKVHPLCTENTYFSYLDVFYKLMGEFQPNVNFWAEHLYKEIFTSQKSYEWNLVTDFRFPNEIDCLIDNIQDKAVIVKTIRVERKSSLKLSDRSETALDDFKFDYKIFNNGTIEDLKRKVLSIIDSNKEK